MKTLGTIMMPKSDCKGSERGLLNHNGVDADDEIWCAGIGSCLCLYFGRGDVFGLHLEGLRTTLWKCLLTPHIYMSPVYNFLPVSNPD